MKINGVDVANSRITQVLLVLLGLLWSTVMWLGGHAWGSSSTHEALREMAVQHSVMNIQLSQFADRIDRLHIRLDRLEERLDIGAPRIRPRPIPPSER